MLTALIMAGGSGERFWPLSTPTKPKQLLNLFSDKSMIRETVDRILPIISLDKIFIATNILQAEEIMKELPEIPAENIIIEPAFKDTAAAIGYTSLIIEERFKDCGEKVEVVVLASDHLIAKGEEFCEIIKLAGEEASKNGVIVTLGIKPTHPETGYGYIEVKSDEPILLNTICKVRRFREKPNFETAEAYLSSGKFLWNSGMFIFTTDTIFKNFEVLMEEHSQIFNELREEICSGALGVELSKLAEPYFQKFEKISIDFGIMEFSKNIRVIPVDIGWNDIGSFTALADVFPADKDNNVVRDTILLSQEAIGNIVIAKDMVVSLLGVENLIVVKNGDNLLIAHKDKAQDIKKIVSKYNELKR
ncbi:MAG: mannose-1-phosphate guanylyltransferase [Fusobacteriaceae bacterium]